MRKSSAWLALVMSAVLPLAAGAQSPLMYGLPALPPYPYAQPDPRFYPAGPMYVPYMPPVPYAQPRIMYVPAGPMPWQPASVPMQPTFAPQPAAPAEGAKTILMYDTGAALKATRVPAQPGVHARTSSAPRITELPPPCESTRCEPCPPAPECSAPDCPAPTACSRHECLPNDNTNWLPKGRWNLQFLGGFYTDIGDATYNFAQTTIRLGKVWDCPCLCHLPGGLEGILELNAGHPVQSDFGDILAGGGFLLRYNVVDCGSRLVPYVQAGLGAQYNDAYQEHNQPFLGAPVVLTGQAQAGLRVFVTKCLSIDLEAGVQYLTNGNMDERNDGIIAVGGMLGVSWFLPCGNRH